MATFLPVDFFATALVIHVDLSVLVWMMAIISMLWTSLAPSMWDTTPRKAAFLLAGLGALCMALSPFFGDAKPLKNNYVPVLQNLSFMLGLSLFFCGMLFQTIVTFIQARWQTPQEVALSSLSIITFVAIVCFVLSYQQLPPELAVNDIEFYYELLFWGGGHILQFTFTQAMLVVWLILISALGYQTILSGHIWKWVCILNLVLVLPILAVYGIYTVEDAEYITLFTAHMRIFGGVAVIIIAVYFLLSVVRHWGNQKIHRQTPIYGAFWMSFWVFLYGGVLGVLISQTNTTVPAHYHGSIVGITLAFMGMVYYMMPHLGYGEIHGKKAAYQPFILGIGQILHITGLAVMGGYGALRKTPGVVQSVDTSIGLGMFIVGGILAVIGGFWFVVLVLQSALKPGKKA